MTSLDRWPAGGGCAGGGERGTTRRIGISYAVAAVGLAVEAGGLALRAWAMHVLGAAYTRTLRTAAEQQVIAAATIREGGASAVEGSVTARTVLLGPIGTVAEKM